MKTLLLLIFFFMTSFVAPHLEAEELQIRVTGDAALPAVIYFPGLHGDWTLIHSFKAAMAGKVRFVEFTYPRTLDWSLQKYAEETEKALLDHGVTNGWLLGESFGSQVVWALAERGTNNQPGFRMDGIILAGGFVKHPNAPGVALARYLCGSGPQSCVNVGLWFYSRYAKFRHRHAPETLAHIDEFVARRTVLDRRAMKHRLQLIAENDPRGIARSVSVPVYVLAGFWDPIVPRWLTKTWLRKHCPSFCDDKTIYNADHNVLGTEPGKSAEQIWNWIGSVKSK